LRVRRLTGLRVIRTVLTIAGMGALIWLGIVQTNRANLLAAQHVTVFQPRDQLKQSVKDSNSPDNQNDDVSKVVGVATLVVLLLQCLIAGRQTGLMRRQTDIYERQADIADGQRQISDRQARIMEGQLVATQVAADAARKQAEVAERAFAGLERP